MGIYWTNMMHTFFEGYSLNPYNFIFMLEVAYHHWFYEYALQLMSSCLCVVSRTLYCKG